MRWQSCNMLVLCLVSACTFLLLGCNRQTAGPAMVRLELRYRVVLDRDGTIQAIPETTPLREDDAVRIEIASATKAAVYVFAFEGSKGARVLLPNPTLADGSPELPADLTRLLPAKGALEVGSDIDALRILVLLSPQPLTELAEITQKERIDVDTWKRVVSPLIRRSASTQTQLAAGEPESVVTSLPNVVTARVPKPDGLMAHEIVLRVR